jgi:hypothetical protein
MPHTRAWSNLIPAGSITADQIEDHIRILREDVFERMNDIVTDWTADPVVLKPASSVFGLTDQHFRIPALMAGIWGNVGDAFGINFLNSGVIGTEPPSGGAECLLPFMLPVGVTLKSFSVTFLRTDSGENLNVELRRSPKAAPTTYATLATWAATVAQPTWQVDVSTTLGTPEVISKDNVYFFMFWFSGTNAETLVHSFDLVYDSPSASNRF